MKKSRSFKKELIYSFLLISFFSITLLGIFQVYQLSSLVRENQKSQATTTKYLADYIGNYVTEHKKAIQTKAHKTARHFENKEMDLIEQQLKDIKTNYPGFVNLYVGDKKGQSILFYPDVYTDGAKRENLNFSDRSYYKELVRTKDTVVSPVLHGRGGTDLLLVTIVSPLLDHNGEMIGYVQGALDLNALSEHIQRRNFGEEGYAAVIDKDWNVVVHPHVDTRRELVNLSKSEINRFIESREKAGGRSFFKSMNPNEDIYITYEKIPPLDWTVWVAKPTDAVTKTYKDALRTILIFLLLTALVLIGVSLVLTNRLERSIQKLLGYIKDYTRDLLGKRPKSKSIRGPKEMEELFFYFNHMIDEVEKNRKELLILNKGLEAKVQERTATLERKNSELKAINKLITSVSTDRDLAQFIQYCLLEIEQFMNYSLHVCFNDLAVTNRMIHTNQNLMMYLNEHMTGVQQYMEPIHIEKNKRGFLVVDLTEQQSISASDQEFLRTFAGSLAVMLQNKFLFEETRNKHAVLEAVLESMSDGLIMVNNKKDVEYVNEFFLNVVEVDDGFVHVADEVTQRNASLDDVYNRFVHLFNVDREELNELLYDKKIELKLHYKEKSKKPKYYLLHNFSVLLDEEKMGEGLLLRDITKEEEIDTLKNNLISLASHEFKTPITTIKGSVETLLRSEVEWEPEFKQELLEGVHEDIERIQHLINDWLDISKIDSGAMNVEPNTIRADHVIELSMESIPKTLKHDAILEFNNYVEEGFTFYADKMRVQQVLINLITNAIRYNDSNRKKVDITLDKENGYTTISVADNGIGISKDHLEKIFNLFYQVDLTATRRTGGTGLGLAICAGIMEAHEGRIKVVSEPGMGSKFIIYFPDRKGEDLI
ncbi:histidine kinase [Neobacillus notoginsengisoli]|uniref:histidine kinase n=1 Tax=Neobacillus notoginsengisoli TaxID=1578198 RepID=A0A417YUL5_9BACI|nr:sensor histidine kinase [Neobacillus notoginsengisoli]RHW40997.1 histidine kinase [Neobacillus notoginsengisoli]